MKAQNKEPKPSGSWLDLYIEEAVKGIIWAIHAGHEHWSRVYTIRLVHTVKLESEKRKVLKLVKPGRLF